LPALSARGPRAAEWRTPEAQTGPPTWWIAPPLDSPRTTAEIEDKRPRMARKSRKRGELRPKSRPNFAAAVYQPPLQRCY
jgi:hypothetical protein